MQPKRLRKVTPEPIGQRLPQVLPDCSVPVCERRGRKRSGLCPGHKRVASKHDGDPGDQPVPTRLPRNCGAACAFEGCDTPARRLGLCHGHYGQQYRGEPLRPKVDRGQHGVR